MPVTVRIPPIWRKFAGRKAEIRTEADTVRDALTSLVGKCPELERRLRGSDGELAQGLSVFVNHQSIKHLDGLDTPLADGDRVLILIAMAGG
jgi:molybdopterin synthase sulfur carrier subunit